MSAAIGASFVALITSLITEFLSWWFVYQSKEYQSLLSQLEKFNKTVDSRKETLKPQNGSNKKLERAELQVKQLTQQLLPYNGRLAFLGLPVVIAGYYFLNYLYGGVVVMKLPFVPFSFLQPLTHRNLEGDDYSELSVHLIFALSMVLYRNILQRMGERRQWRPKQPKQLSIFEMAAAEAEKYDKAK